MKIITIKQFSNEIKARLYHHALEEAGIKSIVSNTISSSLFPIGAGTINLQILKEDKDEGKKIIKNLDKMYQED